MRSISRTSVSTTRSGAGRRGGRRPADVLTQVIREAEPDSRTTRSTSPALQSPSGTASGSIPTRSSVSTRPRSSTTWARSASPTRSSTSPALDQAEWEFVQRHTIIGERILAASPALRDVARIVRSSHERVDGTGYPDRLRAGEIPPEALIIAACNAFHAMTTDRPYRPRRLTSRGARRAQSHAGTQFDPAAVTALVSVLEESRQSVD